MKVLLLEDDAGIVSLVTAYLMNKAEVFSVPTQQEALDIIDEYEVVLLDLNVKGSQGIQTLKIVLDVASIPVIIVTSIEDEDVAIEAIRQGAQEFLVKGQFNAMQLWHAILYARERFSRGTTRNRIKTLEELVEAKSAINEMILREVRDVKRQLESLQAEIRRIIRAAATSRDG